MEKINNVLGVIISILVICYFVEQLKRIRNSNRIMNIMFNN